MQPFKSKLKEKLFLKNLFLLSLIMLFSIYGNCQTMNYTFTQTSATYTAITGGTSPGASFTTTGIATNAVSSVISLPFTFTFNGSAQTQIYISNNGFITFGSTAPASTV